jgi:hypothetical protein
MPTLSIPLPNILIDDADPVDLTTLPEAEAIARIKGIYAFLSAEVEVTIHRGVATITLPDAKTSKAGQALAKIEQATRAAQRRAATSGRPPAPTKRRSRCCPTTPPPAATWPCASTRWAAIRPPNNT